VRLFVDVPAHNVSRTDVRVFLAGYQRFPPQHLKTQVSSSIKHHLPDLHNDPHAARTKFLVIHSFCSLRCTEFGVK